jgi:glycosyltransferase involved in cell wall biosynthesis
MAALFIGSASFEMQKLMTRQIHRNGKSPAGVVHVVPALFGHDDGVIGGAERYALELARHMAAEVPTTLVTFGERERQESLGNLKIQVIGDPWYVRGQRTNPISLALLSRLRKADVVHCHQQHVLVSTFAAVVCQLTGRRVFVSDLGGGGWDISAYVSTDRWYHGHLHISDYSRSVYGHARKRWAHVILGGVDTAKFSPDESVRREPTVLFVGRLLPHKGVNNLVKAVEPDMPLELIGQVCDRKFFEDLKQLAAGKSVTFRHDADDALLVNAYRSASCVVLPSVYKTMYGAETKVPELLGQTLLEGMACETPAICTEVASMPEIIEDGLTGFIVPPNDTKVLGERLRWLRDNPVKAREMGRAARRRVLDKFTWPQVVRRCLEAYAA